MPWRVTATTATTSTSPAPVPFHNWYDTPSSWSYHAQDLSRAAFHLCQVVSLHLARVHFFFQDKASSVPPASPPAPQSVVDDLVVCSPQIRVASPVQTTYAPYMQPSPNFFYNPLNRHATPLQQQMPFHLLQQPLQLQQEQLALQLLQQQFEEQLYQNRQKMQQLQQQQLLQQAQLSPHIKPEKTNERTSDLLKFHHMPMPTATAEKISESLSNINNFVISSLLNQKAPQTAASVPTHYRQRTPLSPSALAILRTPININVTDKDQPTRFALEEQPVEIQRKSYKRENRCLLPNPLIVTQRKLTVEEKKTLPKIVSAQVTASLGKPSYPQRACTLIDAVFFNSGC
jgi:hypothetical protein